MPCVPLSQTPSVWGSTPPPWSPPPPLFTPSPTVLIHTQSPRGPKHTTRRPHSCKTPGEAARGEQGRSREGEPPSPTGYLGLPAAGESSSPVEAGEHKAGAAETPPCWFSGVGVAGVTSEAATSPCPPHTPEIPRAEEEAPTGRMGAPHPVPHQRRVPSLAATHPSMEKKHPPLARCRTRTLLFGEKAPTFPSATHTQPPVTAGNLPPSTSLAVKFNAVKKMV